MQYVSSLLTGICRNENNNKKTNSLDLANKKDEDIKCFFENSTFHSNSLLWRQTRVSQHAQLNEPTCKHTQRSNETHSHEHAQENVVQHHGHKLPLFSSLSREGQTRDSHKSKTIKLI